MIIWSIDTQEYTELMIHKIKLLDTIVRIYFYKKISLKL
jgi:hypothetical protein